MTTPEIRAPREDEAAAVADLFNEISDAAFGIGDTTEDEIRIWFTSPEVDRERDIRLAIARDGSFLAYGDVSEHGGNVWFDIRERPQVGDGSSAKAVLDALLRRGRELARGDEIALRSWVPREEAAVKGMFEREGFNVIRHSFRMALDLADELPEPEWPPGVTVRTFHPSEDERAVYDVQNEGFADTWEYVAHSYEEWLHFLTAAEDFDPALWFLAVEAEEIAGICLCRPNQPGDSDLGWIRVFAVRPAWRRRGIALALLRHALREFRRRGRPRAGLGVDAGSTTGALELYERAGMHVARRSDIYEKTV